MGLQFSAESEGEKNLKIGQRLPKLWAIKYGVVFLMKHGVYPAGIALPSR